MPTCTKSATLMGIAEPRLVNQSPCRSTNTKMPKGRSYTHTTQFTWTQKGKWFIMLPSREGHGQMAVMSSVRSYTLIFAFRVPTTSACFDIARMHSQADRQIYALPCTATRTQAADVQSHNVTCTLYVYMSYYRYLPLFPCTPPPSIDLRRPPEHSYELAATPALNI